MCASNVLKISNLRLITFDITGTLLRPKLELYSEIGAQHGIQMLKLDKSAPSWKHHFSSLAKEHPIYGKHSGLGWENWWKCLVVNLFKEQNPETPDEKLNEIATTLIKVFSTNKGWIVLPGTVNILQYLNNRGIVVGVISNFDKRLEKILSSTGIRKYFSFVISSYDYGKQKPDVALFQEALELATKTRGDPVMKHQALHIGDNLQLDYDGAKNAGWNAFLIGSDEKLNTISKFERFKDLIELQNYFEKSH